MNVSDELCPPLYVPGKHPAKLMLEDCVAMGLVTPDEWERLAEVQAVGMPRFMTAERIVPPPPFTRSRTI